MTTRRILRCTEGHPYDANAHATCPVCGAAPAITGGGAHPIPVPPTPDPRRWTGVALVVAALVVIGGAVGVHLDQSRPPEPQATGPETSTAPAANQAAANQSETAGAAADKAAADKKAAAKAEADAIRAMAAANLKHPPTEPQTEAQARVARFMAVDPAQVGALRRALAPVDPADSNPTLDAVGPAIERQLRLSTFLRAILANERAIGAYRARDVPRMTKILAAVASLPAFAPDLVSVAAHKNLATYYARPGAPPDEMAEAGRLMATAARGGLPSAAVFLSSRPDVAAAAGLDPDALSRFITSAAVEDPPLLEPVLRQRGASIDASKATNQAYDAALVKHDWPTVIVLYQSLKTAPLPVLDMTMAHALMHAPDNAGFMDRALVGAASGGASSYSLGTDLLSVFCLEGRNGVTKDAANAAGWLIATLYGLPKDDPDWAGSRERYRQAKSLLPPDQRQAVAQLAHEFGEE